MIITAPITLSALAVLLSFATSLPSPPPVGAGQEPAKGISISKPAVGLLTTPSPQKTLPVEILTWLSAFQTWLSAIPPQPHSKAFSSAAAVVPTSSLAAIATKPTAVSSELRPTLQSTSNFIMLQNPPVPTNLPGDKGGKKHADGERAHPPKSQLAFHDPLRAGSGPKATNAARSSDRVFTLGRPIPS
ncbi:hypothetical protein EKO04_011313 [Ascochyta lentis]|uniref:Uncharacterized protein n=1 Tax=Ascochyta lentis TaxID=205686 RepID=A0A8H7IWB5_9PLEO|nr:hypothetical protein EKO04_011313 [Ascochyta lentis]